MAPLLHRIVVEGSLLGLGSDVGRICRRMGNQQRLVAFVDGQFGGNDEQSR